MLNTEPRGPPADITAGTRQQSTDQSFNEVPLVFTERRMQTNNLVSFDSKNVQLFEAVLGYRGTKPRIYSKV